MGLLQDTKPSASPTAAFSLHLHAADLRGLQCWGPLRQFKTSHAKRSPRDTEKTAPPARGIWLRHSVPAALHFDANAWQRLQVQKWGEGWEGEKGGRGVCWGNAIEGLLCEALTQIPNVLRAENKNSMGAAAATLAPSIGAPSATQKP